MSRRNLSGRWFEQFTVGDVVEHAVTRTVTETDNVLFTCLTMNPQPMHLDAEFSAGMEPWLQPARRADLSLPAHGVHAPDARDRVIVCHRLTAPRRGTRQGRPTGRSSMWRNV